MKKLIGVLLKLLKRFLRQQKRRLGANFNRRAHYFEYPNEYFTTLENKVKKFNHYEMAQHLHRYLSQ